MEPITRGLKFTGSWSLVSPLWESARLPLALRALRLRFLEVDCLHARYSDNEMVTESGQTVAQGLAMGFISSEQHHDCNKIQHPEL